MARSTVYLNLRRRYGKDIVYSLQKYKVLRKVDYGAILLSVKDDDLTKLEPILSSNIFEYPTIKMSIYKNRRGRYKGVYLWCKADLGCCRIKPMFCTTYSYEMVSIDDVRIKVEEDSAFDCDD